MKRQCGECGQRPAAFRLNRRRNPRSKAALSGRTTSSADHDLCRLCWRALLVPALVAQRVALLREGRRAG